MTEMKKVLKNKNHQYSGGVYGDLACNGKVHLADCKAKDCNKWEDRPGSGEISINIMMGFCLSRGNSPY